MYQKLMTKEVAKKLPKLYSQDGKKPEDVKIIVKYFSPYSNWTWYVTECEEVELEDGTKDYQFFGYVEGFEGELGYFNLSELQNAKRGSLPLVERDMYYGDDNTLADVMKKKAVA